MKNIKLVMTCSIKRGVTTSSSMTPVPMSKTCKGH